MPSRRPRPLFLCLLGLALWQLVVPSEAAAHPHVFVNYQLTVLSDARGITALRWRWQFDALFTSMVQTDFKLPTITPAASQQLHDGAFNNLSHYHFYLDITHDGQNFRPTAVSDFRASQTGNQLVYEFTINLPQPAKQLSVAAYDPEFYVDLQPMLLPSADPATAATDPTFLAARATDAAPAAQCHYDDAAKRHSPAWGDFSLTRITCKAAP